jgi:hypothetical protein
MILIIIGLIYKFILIILHLIFVENVILKLNMASIHSRHNIK